jgi:hypothetical protein
MRSPTVYLTGFVVALTAACGPPLGLPRATFSNKPDTVSLYALSGTPVSSPSAYSLVFNQPIRPDQTPSLDFAFDIDSLGHAKLLPTGALRLGRASGIQLTTTPFDSIKIAPVNGYQLDSAVVVDSNDVAILHSTATTCTFGITTVYYAKLRVIAIDTSSAPGGRRLDFVILTDTNCGYRGLEEGVPKR